MLELNKNIKYSSKFTQFLFSFRETYTISRRKINGFTMSMEASGILSIGEVNALPVEQFVWLFNNVIEHCSEAAHIVANQRPFARLTHLQNAFNQYLEDLNQTDKINILAKHPDLGAKWSEEKLTLESQIEQKDAGINTINKIEQKLLLSYNLLYREKFSFPFVICARQNRIQNIMTSIETRMENEQSEEIINGIEEVKKICSLRIADLVWPEPT